MDFLGSGTSKVHVRISGFSFGEHPLVFSGCSSCGHHGPDTSHFWHGACSNICSITTHNWHISASVIIYSPVPYCSLFYFQSKLCGLPWITFSWSRELVWSCIFVSLEEQGKGWEYLRLPPNSGFSWGYAYILPLYTASISLQLLLFKASFLTVIPPDTTRFQGFLRLQTRPGHTRPDQTRPDQTRPD